MPGLLDYIIQDYQTGGYVNPFDTSAIPTQEDIFGQYDIELTDDKFKPFIPTYDPTGEDFLRTNYMQDRQGLYAGGRSALGQLGQKSSQTAAQQGFAGMGKSLLDTTRGDIVDEFGRKSQKAWTGLQQDIYGRRKDFEEDVLGAVFDLEEGAYTIGGTDDDRDSLEDLPYQGDEITFQGNAAFWNSILNRYEYGTLTTDEEGNTVENIYPDITDPQTPEGGTNINWIDSYASGFDFYNNIGEYVHLTDEHGTDIRLVWDSSQNRYVEYTGG